MAINIKEEKLIRITDVPKLEWLQRAGRAGGELEFSTPYKWARVGLRGIRLEVVRVGGILTTSEAALLRFFERLETPEQGQQQTTPTQRNKSRARAAAILDAAGI